MSMPGSESLQDDQQCYFAWDKMELGDPLREARDFEGALKEYHEACFSGHRQRKLIE